MFSLNSLLVLFFLILLCTSTAFAQDIATIFTLEESIQLAEKNNLQIRSVKKKLKQVKKEERIAKPFALPSIKTTLISVNWPKTYFLRFYPELNRLK